MRKLVDVFGRVGTSIAIAATGAVFAYNNVFAERDGKGCLVEAVTPISRSFDGKLPVYEPGVGYGVTQLATEVDYRFLQPWEERANLHNPDGCPPSMPEDLKFSGFFQAPDGDYYIIEGANPVLKPKK